MPALNTTEVSVTTIASTIRALSNDATDTTTESSANRTMATTESVADAPYITDYPYYDNDPGVNNMGPWYNTEAPDYGYYDYYWDYSFYVLLVFLFLLLLPLILIKMSIRKRQQAARAAALQRAQARRQVEINVNTCSGNMGPAAGGLNTYDPNDISILPKNFDLPPAYDEVVLDCTKQQIQAAQMYPTPGMPTVHNPIREAVSTMTIQTDLESSNNNLAAAATNAEDIEMGRKSNNVAEHSL